jgi:hypothetical protein
VPIFVVPDLAKRNPFEPVMRICAHKAIEVQFDQFIHALCLAIGLQMVGCAHLHDGASGMEEICKKNAL